ncbi:hypothetical protein BGZ52_010025, partial [Haplosporangium bisporale]
DNEVDIARIETLSNPVTASEQHANALFKPVSFAVNSNANDARSSLLTALFTSKSKTIKLKGTVDATFKTISDFAFENDIVLPGLNGLPDVSFVNSKSDGKAGSNLYYAVVKIKMKSPSSLTLTAGKFGFKFNNAAGLTVGTMVLDSMTLEQGDNTVPAKMYIDSLSEGIAGFMKAIDVGDAADARRFRSCDV